jgi:GT2 family glycosyltransferase
MVHSLNKKIVKTYEVFFRFFSNSDCRNNILNALVGVTSLTCKAGIGSIWRIITGQLGERDRKFLNPRNQYQIWLLYEEFRKKSIKKIHIEIHALRIKPKISILMILDDQNEKFLKKTINSVIQQTYRNWELCIFYNSSINEHVKDLLTSFDDNYPNVRIVSTKNKIENILHNEFLSAVKGEFVCFLSQKDELVNDALFEFVKFLNETPQVDYVYADEDEKDHKGHRMDPFFKPDWSPDLFLSINYLGDFSIFRKSLLNNVVKQIHPSFHRYELILKLTETSNRIGHIRKPLYSRRKKVHSSLFSRPTPKSLNATKQSISESLLRKGIKATVTDSEIKGELRISYELKNEPKVSIIILTKDNIEYLKKCIDSLQNKTDYKNYELIIVDNGSREPKTIRYLKSLQKVVRDKSEFNASKLHNFGASNASGEYLLFLNDDIEIIETSWLKELVSIAQREDVGIVGGKLLFPDNTIQHGGVIIGLGGIAGHAFYKHNQKEPSYFNLLNLTRNCSAVTGACMLVKKNIYDKINGFDEGFNKAFGDTDFCLRAIYEAKARVVYTPYAVLIHHEGITRGKKRAPPLGDIRYFEKKWDTILKEGDPYYNPNLSLEESYKINLKPFNN